MKNVKSLIALLIVVLIGTVGGTVAYFTTSRTFTNEFETGIYETSVIERFVSPSVWVPGTTTEKIVKVRNDGEIDVAVRASYTEKWVASDGTTILSGTRNGEPVAQFTVGEEWEKAIDGKYYYKDILAPGETTTNFISSVTYNPNFKLEEGVDIVCTTEVVDGKVLSTCGNSNKGYLEATYTLEITIETIQADQKWKYRTSGYVVGELITIGTENFNVISSNESTVTMLSKYCLNSEYKQNDNRYMNNVTFANSDIWKNDANVVQIDVQKHEGNAKTYVNEYASYLQKETGDATITGALMSFDEIEELGCVTVHTGSNLSCTDASYAEWLINGQNWWISEYVLANQSYIYVMAYDGYYNSISYTSNRACVRPLITISKEALSDL